MSEVDGGDYSESAPRSRVLEIAQAHGGPVLDVGTGECACMALDLAAHEIPVVAIDRSAQAIEEAHKKALRQEAEKWIDFQRGHLTALGFADASFNMVVAFDVLHHVDHLRQAVEEMFRVCTPGGRVVIVDLNAAGRKALKHKDGWLENRLPPLLARYAERVERSDYSHHFVLVCDRALCSC